MIFNLFVYGTLRPSREPGDKEITSWGWDGKLEVIRNATIEGSMWWCGGVGGYPIVRVGRTAPGASGTVVGDIIVGIDDQSFEFERIYTVESGAGYRMVDADATVPGGVVIPVVTWHYKRMVRPELLIPDGNWLAAVGADYAEPTRLP